MTDTNNPQDVLNTIKAAADALGWVAEIFSSIEKELQTPGEAWSDGRIKRLAEMGRYIASDFENIAGSQHDAYERNRSGWAVPAPPWSKAV
jgi:hypothetical protein